MPTLKHLLEELRKLSVDLDEVRIPGQLYDDLMEQAEDIADEEDDENDQIGSTWSSPTGGLTRGKLM